MQSIGAENLDSSSEIEWWIAQEGGFSSLSQYITAVLRWVLYY